MSAIADFSVAVLDCRSCCRHFIESYVAVARHGNVACPHCGADYVEPAALDGSAGGRSEGMSPRAHARRGRLHLLDQRRLKLH